MANIYIGTSGYNYKHWKGIFYPEGLPEKKWLNFYAEHFNTVEINATFYGSFSYETFEKWKNSTPKNFSFSIKGPRFITHVLRLKANNSRLKNSIKRFFDAACGLENKFGAVLWQFPSDFKYNFENKERLVQFILNLPIKDIPQVFEFRHKSWYKDEIYNLLNKKNLGFVISDSPHFPKPKIISMGILYIRFHGPVSLYSSSYPKKMIKDWAQKIKNIGAKKIYCYFNNDANGYALKNAKELIEVLK